ncbi:hypothetical protein [Gottfriedia solisilvae]|uniref:hypothetical protein n=1 Tax=Gottfriedia solisilvae TaxID=1516104 RepID=UPI003D2EAC20
MEKNYSRFIKQEDAYKELKELLESRLKRDLTETEDRSIKWFADCEYETVGIFYDLFKELSNK